MSSIALSDLPEGNEVSGPERPAFGCLRSLLRWSMETQQKKESNASVLPEGNTAEDECRMKARLIAAACHDMRQPLQALGLLTETLREASSLDPRQHELTRQIDQSAGILNDLFNQMLTMLQLDTAYHPDIQDVSIDRLLDQLENDFGPSACRKSLQFSVVRSAAIARCDALLLYRAIGNLVANAISYTERGGVTVRCIEDAGKLDIEVSDTGIGIPAEDIPHIFEDFYRGGRRRSNCHLGLGLANVRRIALLLELRVAVRSEPGMGSTFTIGMNMPAD